MKRGWRSGFDTVWGRQEKRNEDEVIEDEGWSKVGRWGGILKEGRDGRKANAQSVLMRAMPWLACSGLLRLDAG